VVRDYSSKGVKMGYEYMRLSNSAKSLANLTSVEESRKYPQEPKKTLVKGLINSDGNMCGALAVL
jgi:hypothetical protein